MLILLAALALATPFPPSPQGASAVDSIGDPAALAPLLPDTVIAPPGGPRIVVLGAPAPGVAAIRVSVPLVESAPEAGVGLVLRDLALVRMRGLARPVGARVGVTRTPWGLAYTVEGSAADFDYLAYLLRRAVAEPDLGKGSFDGALQEVKQREGPDRETPAGLIAVELRRAVEPGNLPLDGTLRSLTSLDTARVRDVWARTHQTSKMTVVVSASVAPEAILAAIHGLGASAGPADIVPIPTPPPASSRPARPQTLRTWYGVAFDGGARADVRAPVAALLVSDHLRRSVHGFDARVELWDLRDRWVLTAFGAAYQPELPDMRRTVSDAVRSTADALDPDSVRTAVGRVYRSILFQARTPRGLVSVVGRWLDATGDPGAAHTFLDRLHAVDSGDMASYFTRLLSSSPVHAEVRP